MNLIKLSFWLTNISNRNISLTDLNLTIKAFTSVNLLDKKHYNYTLEQLEKSVKNGSIFRKKHAIKKREIPPEVTKENILINKESYMPSRERSIHSIKDEKYEELQVSDVEYAEANAETAELDNQKIQISTKG